MSGALIGWLPLGRRVQLNNGRDLVMDVGSVDEWAHTVDVVPVLLNHDPRRPVGWDRAKRGASTPSMMAMRSLKRRPSNIVYARMLTDQQRREHNMVTGPGRQRGNGATTLTPARPARNPTPALRTSHFPDPPPASLEPRLPPCPDLKGCHERSLLSRCFSEPAPVPGGRCSCARLPACQRLNCRKQPTASLRVPLPPATCLIPSRARLATTGSGTGDCGSAGGSMCGMVVSGFAPTA